MQIEYFSEKLKGSCIASLSNLYQNKLGIIYPTKNEEEITEHKIETGILLFEKKSLSQSIIIYESDRQNEIIKTKFHNSKKEIEEILEKQKQQKEKELEETKNKNLENERRIKKKKERNCLRKRKRELVSCSKIEKN
ncbi:hypothetical protein M0811_02055 [Anaeramoeba ignava]|uniref:Uncharacterized protein n=1 Tax=Anaeramoeba ignava TaxID=1746090 RepID=A0A9Q0LDX0_ANAIG|nr:hypothetical protein M0811_02055 [Anaeramoeba ignava]